MSWQPPEAELHELQGEKFLLFHLPFDAAAERLVPVLERNGSAKVTPSSPQRLMVVGTWRSGPRVRYELTLISAPFAQVTVAQVFSRRPERLDRMLRVQLLVQLNKRDGQSPAPPTGPAPAPRMVAARKDLRFKVTNYDGGLPGHPRPERKAKLVLGRGSPYFTLRWTRAPRGTPKATLGALAQYSLEAQPIGRRSSHLVIRDRQYPSVIAHLELPRVPADRFHNIVQTKIRAHAISWRPMYRVANYNGGLPAHPRPETVGILALQRSSWILRFPGTEQLCHGLITDDSLAVTKTGPNSCRLSISVPQRLGEVATFDLPDTAPEVLSFELATRKDLDPFTTKRLTPAESAQILKSTRQAQQVPVSRPSKKTSPAAAVAAVWIVLAALGLAIGIPIAATHSNNSSSTTTDTAGVTDNCPAGYGYIDTRTGTCYQGSGPQAKNSAGSGQTVNCSADYPYYNAATQLCYDNVPSANSSAGANSGNGGANSNTANSGSGTQGRTGGGAGGGGPGCYACITVTEFDIHLTTGYSRSYPSCFYATIPETGSQQPIVGPNQSDRTWQETWYVKLPGNGQCDAGPVGPCSCRQIAPPYLEGGAPISIASWSENPTSNMNDGDSFRLTIGFQGWAGNTFSGPLDIYVVDCTAFDPKC